jgi:hypothetical protein
MHKIPTQLTAALLAGCAAAPVPHADAPAPVAPAPLGPSTVLLASPGEDESLLGRAVFAASGPASLGDVTRPNECADHLAPRAEGTSAEVFEEWQALAKGERAAKALETFGLRADEHEPEYFYYRLAVDKRLQQGRTEAYVACCKEKGTCGIGFVAALLHGEGRYATASKTTSDTESQADTLIPLTGGADVTVRGKVLARRTTHGYVAAVIRPTAGGKPIVGVLGDLAALEAITEESMLTDSGRSRFSSEKIDVFTTEQNPEVYTLRDSLGLVTEGAFRERYRAVTGGQELPGNASPGTPTIVAGFLVLAAGFVGSVVLAASTSSQNSSSCTQTPSGTLCVPNSSSSTMSGGATAGLLMASGAGALGIPLIVTGITTNKNAQSMTRADAELACARYNRALLRKIAREESAP